MLRDKSQEQAHRRPSPRFLRRFQGPKAREVFLRCRPDAGSLGRGVAVETESIYRHLQAALELEGGTVEHAIQETAFFHNIACDLPAFLDARSRTLQEVGFPGSTTAAPTYVEQPPLDVVAKGDASEDVALGGTPAVEILVRAVIPNPESSSETWGVRAPTRCNCSLCSRLEARSILLGDEKHVFAGNVFGAPGAPFDESLSMFEVAADLLRREGMEFRSVMRTWIYLRDMDRDYGELNRARRRFFHENGVTVLPASTGINGSPFPSEHNFVLGFYAIEGPGPIESSIMTTPTLNEAHEYGSDFSRGMRVEDSNKTTLYISGTASVDEEGRTVHEEDFEGQVERMLLNVSVLLEKQGATFDDMVSAITYIKRASDAPTFRRIMRDRKILGFPNVIVEAGVCRPDLLCEIEGIAILPH